MELRREGELAFYCHGPNRSMVTIGIFGIEDFDPQKPAMTSPRLVELRKRYPYNLQNGQGVRRTATVTTASGQRARVEKIEPSRLVAIPER